MRPQLIGPYCIVGDEVYDWRPYGVASACGRGTRLTRIGEHNQFYQFASVGEDPQDLKYAGERTWLEIGDHNTIREACSLHRGTDTRQ